MKQVFIVPALFMTLTMFVSALDPLIEGVERGRFTQDYDSAVQYAAEYSMPIFLDFTGSDWCPYCRYMVQNVFSRDDWSEYAAENLVLVTIDFPRDETIVPEEYRERNRRLRDSFNIQGVPMYVLLDSNGSRELGRLGYEEGATPSSFITKVNDSLRFSIAYLEAFSSYLTGAMQEQFDMVVAEIRESFSESAPAEQNESRHRWQINQAFDHYMIRTMSEDERAEFQMAQVAYREAARGINELIAQAQEGGEGNSEALRDYFTRLDEASETILRLRSKHLP